jgi:[acyl-carrier-protein] S-malonyltransferase
MEKSWEEPMAALVFPGQGSQRVGMGHELYRNFEQARRVFEEVGDALRIDIARACFEGPEDALMATETAQPAILCVSLACYRVMESENPIKASFLCGHSLGEYTALVASGAITISDAARLVSKRGKLMQSAVARGEGGMTAILGLTRPEVESICQSSSEGEVLSPANYNAPTQIVISGHLGALKRAAALVKAQGGKAVELSVSAPFHCPLMELAAKGLAKEMSLLRIHPFRPGIVTNVEAKVNESEGRVKDLLIQQVTSPVRWEESVRWMIGRGVRSFVEVGPGHALSNLIVRIDKSVTVRNIEKPQDLWRGR